MQLVFAILVHWIVIYLAEVVQKVNNVIDRINLYPLDSAIGFPNTCPLDSDLSGGHCYASFEQPGPGGKCYPTFEQPGPDKSLSIG